MNQILLAGNGNETNYSIIERLGDKYKFIQADSIESSEEKINTNTIDLVVADFNLIDGQGSELCASIKFNPQTKHIPFIFLTSSDDIEDKIIAYNAGADDFISKPFNTIELDLKIMARLKNSVRSLSQIKNDGLLFNIEEQKLFALDENEAKTPIDLTPIEAKLIYNFLSNPHEIFSREQLIDKVWGSNIHVINRTIDKHISRIRKKLNATEYAIKARHGSGYILERKSQIANSNYPGV